MTAEPSFLNDQTAWQRVVSSYRSYIDARKALFQAGRPLIPLVRQGLSTPTERGLALEIAAALPTEERKELLGDLIALASFGHGRTMPVRRLILSLPHDWLKTNIGSYAAPILEAGSDEECRRLLELYSELDRDLAIQLARQAAASTNPEVADVGRDFLATLGAPGPRADARIGSAAALPGEINPAQEDTSQGDPIDGKVVGKQHVAGDE